MLTCRLSISSSQQVEIEKKLKAGQRLGRVKDCKRLAAIRMLGDLQRRLELALSSAAEHVARAFGVTVETVLEWTRRFVIYGIAGLKSTKSPGRPAKLTSAQKARLVETVKAGPEAAGFPGACWRTPMIQEWIKREFGVVYNAHYVSDVLRNLGFSFQKARFVSDHLDEIGRRRWREQTFPALVTEARKTNAWLLFGDEASFPQWGTLSYTWATRGEQPTVKTSGIRKGYKIFGLLDYFTGRFWHTGIVGRLNSASYEAFLTDVLASTTRPLILIQDGARYHTSRAMQAFFKIHRDRVKVVQLPAYSPDYNPIERLWKRIKQTETHLHYFPTFEALVEKVQQALIRFENIQAEVLELCVLAA